MIDGYDWASGREAMIRLGPNAGPVALVTLPLFEEANRTRTFAVGIMRQLAERGIASALPDLPGTGESLTATVDATLAGWRTAFDAAVTHVRDGGRAAYGVAIRSGALIDSLADLDGRWQFAPLSGHDAVRGLLRTKQAAARESGQVFDPDRALDPSSAAVEIAGNLLSPRLLDELSGALPRQGERVRVVRLETDSRAADRTVAGAPLWRRAEPGDDAALAAVLAQDIHQWLTACEG